MAKTPPKHSPVRAPNEDYRTACTVPKTFGTKYIKQADGSDRLYHEHKYGIFSVAPMTPLTVELFCAFDSKRPPGALSRYHHLKNAVNLMLPKRIWHDWTERRFKGLMDYNFVSWSGCASSGKTDDAALYATLFWLYDPEASTVILTSTTKEMIQQRMWSSIQRVRNEVENLLGNPLPGRVYDSKTHIRVPEIKNPKSGIFAKAVRQGSITQAAGEIQGWHNRRVLVVIDEGSVTPAAIYSALANLAGGCEHFQVLVIANPDSQFDEHGKFSEPKDGWESVDVETKEWETVTQLDGKPGLCQRFDAKDSPFIVTGNKEFDFLMSKHQYEGAAAKMGETSPEWWKYYRGFWAPDGVCRTVLSDPLIRKHGGLGQFQFHSKGFNIAALDPAFGGDNAVLVFARVGDIEGKKLGIQITERLVLKADVTKKDEPIEYQLARQVKEHCDEREVSPENFGLDATGTGRGVYSVVFKEWSSRIRKVEFGGKASDHRVSLEDKRPGKEVYDRRVTELWFNVRSFLTSGQLRGFYTEAIKDLCSRLYSTEAKRISVETKEEMKARVKRSPDDGDAVSVLCEVARLAGVSSITGAQQQIKQGETPWEAKVRELNAIYQNTYAEAAA